MGALQGLITTDSSFLPASLRPESWRAKLVRYFINNRPFTALLSLIPHESVQSSIFNVFELEYQYKVFYLASAGAGDTTLNVSYANPYDASKGAANELTTGTLLLIEATGEYIRVTGSPTSSTAVPVARGQLGSTAQSIPANTKVIVVGDMLEEGYSRPVGITYTPTSRVNYTMQFTAGWEFTTRFEVEKKRIPNFVAEKQRDAFLIFSEKIERALIWSKKGTFTINGKPGSTTDGILQFIDSSKVFTPPNGVLTEELLDSYLVEVFKHGNAQEKLALCGNNALYVLNEVVKQKYHIFVDNSITGLYGITLQKYISPTGGILYLKQHPLFAVDPDWNNNILIVDPDYMRLRILQDITHTVYTPETLQARKWAGQFDADLGLEVLFPKAFALIKNIVSWA